MREKKALLSEEGGSGGGEVVVPPPALRTLRLCFQISQWDGAINYDNIANVVCLSDSVV